ncbi:MAG: Lrp/AsnC family transcriptional regulator [Candidatus Kariarchaeaceae archaeon]|jgi:DNA-binding Lrp family transcriptional regulator
MNDVGKLDQTDLEILKLLRQDSQQPLKTLAERLNSKTSTIHARIKKLEKNNIIQNYTVNINKKAIGQPLVGYVMLIFEKSETNLDQVAIGQQIAELPRAQEVHLIAGEYDILIKVRAKDIEDLGTFVTKELKDIEGVGPSRTFVSLNIVKESSDPPYPIEQSLAEYLEDEIST